MSRKIGTGLIGLGVFLIVAAGLIRFYAYPSMATVPTNYQSVTQLAATDAEVFNSDPSVLAPETVDLSIESQTTADSATEMPDGVATWVNSVTITRADGSVFQQSMERTPFDKVTGAAVDCSKCGSWTEESKGDRVDVERSGQVYKFPFNTQKKDYEQWDDSLGEATTAAYAGETDIDGLKVYKFVQTIAPTQIGTLEVPGSVFDVEDASVQAEMWYGMTRTLYIEPVTGAPVNRVEDRVQELRYDDTAVPAFTGTVAYTDDQVDSLVKDTKTNAMLLGGMRGSFPLTALILGLLALGGGVAVTRRRRGTRHDDRKGQDRLVNA